MTNAKNNSDFFYKVISNNGINTVEACSILTDENNQKFIMIYEYATEFFDDEVIDDDIRPNVKNKLLDFVSIKKLNKQIARYKPKSISQYYGYALTLNQAYEQRHMQFS